MDNINKSLEVSIFSENAKELITDYSELALDKFIDNDAISEIPIIKSIVGFYKGVVGIQKVFTIKKIIKFLFKLNGVSIKDRDTFLNKISLDESYKNDIIEKLLIILDRLDDLGKAEIIGNLFKATIQQKMSVATFLKLSSIVDRFYIGDFKTLIEKRDVLRNQGNDLVMEFDIDLLKYFSSVGLISEEISVTTNGYNNIPRYSFKYLITELGRYLVSFAYPEFVTIVVQLNPKY